MNREIITLIDKGIIDEDPSNYINDLELMNLKSYEKENSEILYGLVNQKRLYFVTKDEYELVIKRMNNYLKNKATDKQLNYLKSIMKKQNKKIDKPLCLLNKKEASILIKKFVA